jgi:hypothetical protein
VFCIRSTSTHSLSILLKTFLGQLAGDMPSLMIIGQYSVQSSGSAAWLAYCNPYSVLW